MIDFPVSLVIEFDEDAATSGVVAIVGEVRRPLEVVRLRPEHNNPVDAVRIVTSSSLRDELDYYLEDPSA